MSLGEAPAAIGRAQLRAAMPLTILAEPLDPGQAIVARDGLPTLAFGQLPAAQRQSLLAAAG